MENPQITQITQKGSEKSVKSAKSADDFRESEVFLFRVLRGFVAPFRFRGQTPRARHSLTCNRDGVDFRPVGTVPRKAGRLEGEHRECSSES
jgi:hypothetical protein